ncbi:AfsR/SARP family transcriptional regulator [Microlunatus speluncae]|uniref:AfsR/SARP family transcriptional regulator n=1 Tax=Microlunatus speluncae TaxID=2594267 RepID=UPI00126685E8|nr:BTAD domain-containing putative transcriptional regulator [Microlunatus speluncae]
MEIRVLGEIELWRDGQRLDAVVGKQSALLAVLLSVPELTASQDLLTDQLWPDRDPEAGLVSLHTCVYRLRKSLGHGTARLHRQGDGYRLELGSDDLDLHRFEQLVETGREALARGDHDRAARSLRAALGLWRGEAMGGIDIAVVQEYARGLDDARLDATEWALTADLALERQEEVSRETERLIARYPFRERFWELSMVALVRAGRQSAALQRYRELFRHLDEELGIQPSPSVQQLHQRILDGDQDVISELPDGLTGRSPVAVPRQLPPPIGRLAGRADELAQLSQADAETGPMITVITGQAGIGKTTLALSWAHSVADRFPDGQLYVNLLGFDASGRIRTVGEVVRTFLIGMGIDDQALPRDTDDQLALFRTLTADRRLLVVLDNARNTDQVRPLLPPGSSCRVVITSRDQLAGLIAIEGADSITLDLLDAEASEQLLTGRIGAERIAVDRGSASKIIESCGRLPLALALVAAQVASRPRLSLAEAVRSIFDPRRGLDALELGDSGASLRQVFSWSYSTVDPAAARLFRLLGVHPGPDLSAAAAASLAAVEPGEALRLLDRLTTANLLTEHLPDRYLLHDLLRHYAVELARTVDGAEEVERARRRVLDHYLLTAHALALAYDPPRTPITLPSPAPGVTPEPASHTALMPWAKSEFGVLRSVIEWGWNEGPTGTSGVWSGPCAPTSRRSGRRCPISRSRRPRRSARNGSAMPKPKPRRAVS